MTVDLEAPVAQHVYGKLFPRPGMRFPRADTTGLKISAEVDPRARMEPVFDQGQLGSCTANATCGLFEYDTIVDGNDCGRLARLWVYYFERKLEGSLGQGDVGAIGHDAFRVARHGIPPESDWPYDITTFQNKPGPDLPRAYYLKKPVAAPAQSQNTIKQVLSNQQTIAFGFTVYESFESQELAQTGVMPVPKPGEQILGGHEILAVGYLQSEPNYVLCRNSWSAAWGLNGYLLFPWSCFLDSSMTSDFRTIVRAA